MSRLDQARGRMDAALENLEKTAKNLGESRETAISGRLAALESERQTLLARVAELEEELAALSSVSSEVENRLDGAIGEIRAALAR
jgi:seryl-tRNA synthetase